MGKCTSLASLKQFLRSYLFLSRATILFLFILNCPQGALPLGEAAVADGMMASNILCLLKWQETFFTYNYIYIL